MRQKDIPTDGTSDKNRAIIGEVLTENVAKINNNKILY
tara:strand:+ start:72 stop:185 length:114 start_codon:yes stop_codon:yes gene_type:complete